MEDTKDYSYDWLRAFSAIMIVLCHICQGFGISPNLAYYLGGTYVSVFLVLSAYLLGKRYSEYIINFPFDFLKKRVIKLVPTYYTYLIILFFIIAVFTGREYLSIQQIIGHFLFLNWFVPSIRIYSAPLPQLGHLWFMSAIISAYVSVVIFSKIHSNIAKYIKNFWTIYMLITFCVGIYLCDLSRHFIYPSIILVLFPSLFYNGDKFIGLIRNASNRVLITTLLISNLVSIIGFYHGLYENSSVLFIAITINAILWIASAPILFYRRKTTIPTFISMISFEIYLIHHPFCLGYYSLSKYMSTEYAVIGVFIISIVLGYILHLLCKK